MKELSLQRERSVCFTGHRSVPPERKDFVLRSLDASIKLCADRGYENFIAGGALGFDTMAACRIIAARHRYGGIRLILALPSRTQTDGWPMEDVKLYRRILGMADEAVYLSDFYYAGCYHARNDWMVDHSSVCISYLTKKSGGTAYTVGRAKRSGLAVCNLADSPYRGINFPEDDAANRDNEDDKQDAETIY